MSKVKSYPFITKSQIRSTLESTDTFVVQCLTVMHSRQTGYEQETKSTITRNRAGFMSSHAVKGTTLAIKAAAEGLTEAELSDARALCLRYTKQLAAHFRAEAIEADPELAAAAVLFSAS